MKDLRWAVTRVVAFLGVVAFVGCFRGEFYAGQRCRSDSNCGPRLSCVQGYCGGGAVGSGGGSSDGAASTSFGTHFEPGCGNGIVEADELCDDGGESATCNDDCTFASCGDELVNHAAGEDCEGEELQEATCEDQGFYGGQLSCREGCAYDDSGCFDAPGVPVLVLGFSQVKRYDFSWTTVLGAQSYQLLESPTPGEPFEPIGEEMLVEESVSFTMPLHARYEASYRLRACNGFGCTESESVGVVGSLAEAIGYFKSSNADSNDRFGFSIALSGDGSTLAVGTTGESSGATGIDGDQTDISAPEAGAVHVFARDSNDTWSQQAYVKASNTGESDRFGTSVELSDDGSTLAVGAPFEDSGATGIDGDQTDESAFEAGAAYVFVRDEDDAWSQQAYIKTFIPTGGFDFFGDMTALSGDGRTLAVGAIIGGGFAGVVYVFACDEEGTWSPQSSVGASSFGEFDSFGSSLTLSTDGSTLAVGATGESSAATGIDGDQNDNSSANAGAAYVFVRDESDTWSQQAYIKASNTDSGDHFGSSAAISDDGNILVIGAYGEDGDATSIGLGHPNNSAPDAGAVYIFVREGTDTWSQQAYFKAPNAHEDDWFGISVALSDDGRTLVVGAAREDSDTTGVGAEKADDSKPSAGAVYVFSHGPKGTWSQQTYVKASNTDEGDRFGISVAISSDGRTLAVGADQEDGSVTGVGGDATAQADDDEGNSGAVYVY